MDEKTEGIPHDSKFLIETSIRIALIAIMAVVTVRITMPFLMPVAWGVIIAVAVNPFITSIANKLGGRKKLTSILFAVIIIAALIVPSVFLVASSIETVHEVAEALEVGTFTVPDPPESVAGWPLIGEKLYAIWKDAHSNLGAVLTTYGPQLKDLAMTLLGTAGGTIRDVLMFVIAIAIASVLMITADKGSEVTRKIFSRFIGEKGPEHQKLATATIRGVMLGVIGVALIQSILAALGMVLVGVPAAGLWALLVLVFAVIQIPPLIILGPVAAWVFTFADTIPAVLFLVWALAVSGCDGFLKPVLMGRGVDAPMLVILIGALGGMMTAGIIGLFVGAVIVAVSYTIFMAWLDDQPSIETSDQQEKSANN
ncbi:MAG: AI-2E family transporter [Desulfocapsaceae bacterium]